MMHRSFRRAALGAALLAALPLVPPALARQASAPTSPTVRTVPAAGGHHGLRDRFAAADTDHDGHLTLAEAQAAGMNGVVRNFDAIDTGHRGYVTLDDIQAFHRSRHAGSSAPAAAGNPNGNAS